MAAITRVKALKSFDQSEILEITACKSQRCESCEGGAKCNTRKQEEPRVMHVLTTKKFFNTFCHLKSFQTQSLIGCDGGFPHWTLCTLYPR